MPGKEIITDACYWPRLRMCGALPLRILYPFITQFWDTRKPFSVTCYRDIKLFSSQHWESSVVCELWAKEQNIKERTNEWMDLKGLQCEMGANDKLYSRPPASLMTRHDLLSLHSPAMFVPHFVLLARTMGTHAVMSPKIHVDIENKDTHMSGRIAVGSSYAFMSDMVSNDYESYHYCCL